MPPWCSVLRWPKAYSANVHAWPARPRELRRNTSAGARAPKTRPRSLSVAMTPSITMNNQPASHVKTGERPSGADSGTEAAECFFLAGPPPSRSATDKRRETLCGKESLLPRLLFSPRCTLSTVHFLPPHAGAAQGTEKVAVPVPHHARKKPPAPAPRPAPRTQASIALVAKRFWPRRAGSVEKTIFFAPLLIITFICKEEKI